MSDVVSREAPHLLGVPLNKVHPEGPVAGLQMLEREIQLQQQLWTLKQQIQRTFLGLFEKGGEANRDESMVAQREASGHGSPETTLGFHVHTSL